MTAVLTRGGHPEIEQVPAPDRCAAPVAAAAPAPGRPGGGPVRCGGTARPPGDVVDQWGLQSFPASDPPSNW